MRKLFFIAAFLSGAFYLSGQYDITFDIKNYESDTAIVGYYIMDKQLVQDTLLLDSTEVFRLQGQDTLASGVYLFLTQPDNQYIQFMVNEDEQSFSVTFDYKQKEKIEFENSVDNQVFQSYIEFLNKIRPEADMLKDTIAKCKEQNLDFEKFQSALDEIDRKVVDEQQRIISGYPNTVSAMMIKANIEIDIPDFEGEEDQNQKRYLYYKKHYFDNIDLQNPATLRTPFLFDRIDYYINKLTPNHPDSICESLDTILKKLENSGETFNYYLSHYLNSYGKSKIIGYDAIYVHLVDNYYAVGKAPWVEEDNLIKIIDNANKIKPVLIGKTGADIMVYDEFENPISISDIDYEYLVLLFWAPDCSHCKKSMPKFIEFNEKWKDRGVRVFAICSKHQDKVNDCWEYVREKNMHGFINGADKFHKSRFKVKYNVSTTPKVFILNKEREILMKNVGAEQLDRVMEEVILNQQK